MGALMRACDWAATPCGPVHDWPSCLATTVSLGLNSRFPTVSFWGPGLCLLYNDAYVPVLADKHPASLGRPAREVFSGIWSIIGPMLEGVPATGEATYSYDLCLPIVHNGAASAHYFTFSYSPIRDETGQVRGVFCPVMETPERKEAEAERERLVRQRTEEERRLSTLVDMTSDEVWFCDPHGVMTLLNVPSERGLETDHAALRSSTHDWLGELEIRTADGQPRPRA